MLKNHPGSECDEEVSHPLADLTALTALLFCILTWIFFSLFELLIDKKPMNETLFRTFNLIFLVVISLVETRVYYRKFVKNEKKSS